MQWLWQVRETIWYVLNNTRWIRFVCTAFVLTRPRSKWRQRTQQKKNDNNQRYDDDDGDSNDERWQQTYNERWRDEQEWATTTRTSDDKIKRRQERAIVCSRLYEMNEKINLQ